MNDSKQLHIDTWPWGKEKIIWGYDLSHAFTCKIIEPKKGRAGCLSLQRHHEKSELWIVFRGTAWIIAVSDDIVCTRIMQRGDIQVLPVGTIHRLMALSDDLQIMEPSTPDRHAADKSVSKDVVRLHCVHGRQVSPPTSSKEEKLIEQCIQYTEEAISFVESDKTPPEYNTKLLQKFGFMDVDG